MIPFVWIVIGSLFWAVTGHGLFLFYRSLWRGLSAMMGTGKPEQGGAVDPALASEASAMTDGHPGWPATAFDPGALLRIHGLRVMAVCGALLAALSVWWLIDDLVSDRYLQKWIQLLSLMLLTGALSLWGYRIRRDRPDVIGTGLMVIGYLMVPADAAFYIEYILKQDHHNAWLLLACMAAAAIVVHRRTGSRTFAWLAPLTLLASVIGFGVKLELQDAGIAALTALVAPVILATGLWLGSTAAGGAFRRPFVVTGALSAIVAMMCALGNGSGPAPDVTALVGLVGGGTLSVAAYLEGDLRWVLVVVPYLYPLLAHRFHHDPSPLGAVGPASALAALALLVLERRRRAGADRQRGLDPWCSVPALALLSFAAVADFSAIWFLIDRLEMLRSAAWLPTDPASLVDSWFWARRTLFTLVRIDPTLVPAILTGLSCALGLAYLGAATRIPFFPRVGGIPLAVGLVAALLLALPPEIQRQHHGPVLTVAVTLLFVVARAVEARGGPGSLRDALAITLRSGGHLLVLPAYLLLGFRVFPDLPLWYEALGISVLGIQCIVVGRRISTSGWRLPAAGTWLVAMGFPLAIASLNIYDEDLTLLLVGLTIVSLVTLSLMLWRAITAGRSAEALPAALGIAACLFSLSSQLSLGAFAVKLVVMVVGLGLLVLGARSRGGPAAGLVLAVLCGDALARPTRPLMTRATIAALAAANPADPLIALRCRVSRADPGTGRDTDDRWNVMKETVSAMSGLDSAAAALQLATGDLRIWVGPEHTALVPLAQLPPAALAPLNWVHMARNTPAGRMPDRAGGLLAGVPADRAWLRFSSPTALERMLAIYEQVGRKLLAVASPGLALPGPREAFRRGLGADPVAEAAGAGAGVVSIGDPYLQLGTDVALVLEMPSADAATKRVQDWGKRFGAARSSAVGTIAVLATTPEVATALRLSLTGEAGSAVTLAAAEDFRYASLLSLAAPDGALFLSEAFVARLISPAFFVAHHRRLDCMALQADVEAAIAFGRTAGKPLPGDPEAARLEAMRRGWVVAGHLCRSDGKLATVAGAIGCTVHGSRHEPLPLSTALTSVHEEEQRAYAGFVARYRGLYSKYVDPIEVGITLSGEGVMLDTVILPVARQPFYTELRTWVARGSTPGGPIELPPEADHALAGVALRGTFVSPAAYRELIDIALDPGLVHPRIAALLMPGDTSTLVPPPELYRDARPVPVLAFQGVATRARGEEVVRELFAGRGAREIALPGGQRTTGHGGRVFGNRSLFGASGDRWIAVATDPGQVESALAAPARTGRLPSALAWLAVAPRDLVAAFPGQLGRAGGVLGSECRSVLASMQNSYELVRKWPLPSGAIPSGPPFVDPATECPGGGRYSLAGECVTCSLHGTAYEPAAGAPLPGSPLARLLDAVTRFEVEIAVQPEGVRTQITVSGALAPAGGGTGSRAVR